MMHLSNSTMIKFNEDLRELPQHVSSTFWYTCIHGSYSTTCKINSRFNAFVYFINTYIWSKAVWFYQIWIVKARLVAKPWSWLVEFQIWTAFDCLPTIILRHEFLYQVVSSSLLIYLVFLFRCILNMLTRVLSWCVEQPALSTVLLSFLSVLIFFYCKEYYLRRWFYSLIVSIVIDTVC